MVKAFLWGHLKYIWFQTFLYIMYNCEQSLYTAEFSQSSWWWRVAGAAI